MPAPAASRENGKKGGRPKGPTPKTRAKMRGRERALRQAEITAERTMLEIARVAFIDRRGIWGPDGRLKPLSEWTADEAALLEGLEVVIKNAAAGDGHTDTVHKVKLATKQHALELLAKHFGLTVEKLDITHRVTLEDIVVASLKPSD